ncbi:MAG: hypothetical protein IJ660_00910 [Alphaproteobacteria bacterium]|nr:hypothetical protein [Alphaproteobacteria bacterium]
MQNVSQLIQAFGGLTQMSRDISVPVSTIQGWDKSKNIPSWRIDNIRHIAKEKNINLDSFINPSPEAGA